MTRKQPLYLALSTLVGRLINLRKIPGKEEAEAAVEGEIERLCKEHMPEGSGFDAGTQLNLLESCKVSTKIHSSPSCLAFGTKFHHMDEQGSYDGWTSHSVLVYADWRDFTVRVRGPNKNDIRNYISESFYLALSQEVEADAAIMQRP